MSNEFILETLKVFTDDMLFMQRYYSCKMGILHLPLDHIYGIGQFCNRIIYVTLLYSD